MRDGVSRDGQGLHRLRALSRMVKGRFEKQSLHNSNGSMSSSFAGIL